MDQVFSQTYRPTQAITGHRPKRQVTCMGEVQILISCRNDISGRSAINSIIYQLFPDQADCCAIFFRLHSLGITFCHAVSCHAVLKCCPSYLPGSGWLFVVLADSGMFWVALRGAWWLWVIPPFSNAGFMC